MVESPVESAAAHAARYEDPFPRPSAVTRWSHPLSLAFVGSIWGLRVSGVEHIPQEGPLIIASNHLAWWDGPLLVMAAGPRRYLRFLTKIEAMRTPILGAYLRRVGMVPLDRSRSDVGALRAAFDVVRAGGCLGLFPEGTRSPDGRPRRPKPGVGLIARETGAAVVPARVLNTDRSWRLGRFEIRFGPPLRFEASAGGKAECQAFAEDVMRRIMAL